MQLTKNARTEKHRAVIAAKAMSRVTRQDLQALVYAMRRDRNSPATIQLGRAMLRVLFNHAFAVWRWADLADNPATMLKMPQVGSLKVERLHGQRFVTRRHVKDETIAWLLWYNKARLHSTAAYVSPMQFESEWLTRQASS